MKKEILIFILPVWMFASCHHQSGKEQNAEGAASADRSAVSNNSIYQIGGSWTDQNNQSVSLEKLKGKVQIIAMIFTHCKYICPRTVADIKVIESQIPNDKRKDIGFVLVSFDTERDSAQRLGEFYNEMQLNDNWVLLHGTEQKVRELSVLLNVQYDKQEDGSFSHSVVITVLNKEGEISFQQQGLGADPKATLETINKLLR